MMMDIDEVLLSRRLERKTPVSVLISPLNLSTVNSPTLILHSQTTLQVKYPILGNTAESWYIFGSPKPNNKETTFYY